jgi:hypothetical protein
MGIRFTNVYLLLLFATILSACGSTQASGISTSELEQIALQEALERAAIPPQDVLVWTIDRDNKISSYWIKGSPASTVVIGSRSGLLFPASSGVWELRESEVELPLCDCELWMQQKMVGECPQAESGAASSLPQLVDLVSGKNVDLLPQEESQEKKHSIDSQVTSSVSITGSVGPYLFISHNVEKMPCGNGNPSSSSDFIVFDVEKGDPVDIFEPEERNSILETEQAEAFNNIKSDPNISAKSPSDIEFTQIEPELLLGSGLALSYQFTARAFYSGKKGGRSAYSRSATITAKKLPQALMPYATLPLGIQNVVVLSDEIRLGGWIPIEVNEEQQQAFKTAFGL